KVWKTGRLVLINLFKQTRQEEGGKLSVCPCLKSHYQEVGRRTREVGEGGQEGGRWRVTDGSPIWWVCVCERERERERERECVCVRNRERERVCVRQRERECTCVCV